MTTLQGAGEESLRARYTYRLRVSSTALAGLDAEWARCRWIWNECVAMSRKVHGLNKTATEKVTCGPAQLDKMLTEARTAMGWLGEGASVPQQQTIRDFAKSRAKALKDVKAGLSMRQRAGMPRIKRKRDALPSMNYTRRGFRLKDGRLHLAGGIALTVVWSRVLPADPTSVRVYRDSLGHWYASFVVETRSWPGTRSRWRGGSPHGGGPRRRATGRRPVRRPRSTRRLPGSGRTPAASGPRRSCVTSTSSPSRTSSRSSSRSPRWPARLPTRRSARPGPR